MVHPVLVFGASALTPLVLDIFQSNEVLVYGILDDDPKKQGLEMGLVSVLGSTEDEKFLKLLGKKTEAFLALPDNTERRKQAEILAEDYKVVPVNALHAQAWVEPSAQLGHGNLLAARVVLASGVKLGSHALLHTGALVDYQAEIGDFAQIGAGAIIGAEVKVGEGAFIGAGAVLVPGITIGAGASVGAGSVVVENVPARARVFGNPAAKV